ncbi:MAG: hypothetical protein K6V97_00245 [Actinomycetia bacterium]|jgi:hypothetical protein|nr:hypothetical protein [Actinomycetes bacterium]
MGRIIGRIGSIAGALLVIGLGGWLEARHHLMAGGAVFVVGVTALVWATGATTWEDP